jgi:TfoX/Sxy family transcriptional regulator of competence genes
MAYDAGLAERIREALADRAGVTERRMFGGLAFMLDGHVFAGIVGSTLMARVGAAGEQAALARAHVRPMDFTGRPMKGYVYVDPEGIAEDLALCDWIDGCIGVARALPPKAAKPVRQGRDKG